MSSFLAYPFSSSPRSLSTSTLLQDFLLIPACTNFQKGSSTMAPQAKANYKTYEAQARLVRAIVAAHPEVKWNYKGTYEFLFCFLVRFRISRFSCPPLVLIIFIALPFSHCSSRLAKVPKADMPGVPRNYTMFWLRHERRRPQPPFSPSSGRSSNYSGGSKPGFRHERPPARGPPQDPGSGRQEEYASIASSPDPRHHFHLSFFDSSVSSEGTCTDIFGSK